MDDWQTSPQPSTSSSMFRGIIYALDPALEPSIRERADGSLVAHGAIVARNISEANLVIVNSTEFEGSTETQEDVTLVTPVWLDHCLKHGKRYNYSFYSPNHTMIFSGMICTQSDLPRNDIDAISAGIEAFGGQWRHAFTRDVTHLFCLQPEGTKYQTALYHKAKLGIEIILPHWFDDCYKLQQRLPTETYSFPNPTIFNPLAGLNVASKTHPSENVTATLKIMAESKEKNALYRTLLVSEGERSEKERKVEACPWDQKSVIISSDLMLSDELRGTFEAKIILSGGKVIQNEDQCDSADIVVCKYRYGDLYDRAVKGGKIIGSLAWLYYVDQVGRLASPLDQLLHFPIPSVEVEGFKDFRITVTNYQGDSRDYLKKLITCMGAEFTATMSHQNTHVIAAHPGGTKAERATKWNIPVLNHTWLEDCFFEWKNIPIGGVGAAEKYSNFPIGVNFMHLLGTRRLSGFAGVDPTAVVGNLALRNQPAGPAPTLPGVSEPEEQQVTEPGPTRHPTSAPTRFLQGDEASIKGATDAMELDTSVDQVPENEGAALEEDLVNRVGLGTRTERTKANGSRGLNAGRGKQTSAGPIATSSVLVTSNALPRSESSTMLHRTARATNTLARKEVIEAEPTATSPPAQRRSPNRKVQVEVCIPFSPMRPRADSTTPLERSASAAGFASRSDKVEVVHEERNALHKTLERKKSKSSMAVRQLTDDINEAHPTDDEETDPVPVVSSKVAARTKKAIAGKASAVTATAKTLPAKEPAIVEGLLRPRRGAATAAAVALKDAMEDVCAYEKDMKTSHGDPRKMKMSGFRTEVGPPAGPSRPKKRPRDAVGNDAEDEAEGSVPKKRLSDVAGRMSAKGKRRVPADEEDSSGEEDQRSSLKSSDRGGSQRTAQKGASKSKAPAPRPVRIMTTKYDINKEDLKILSKLGAKMTEDPEECTHLITQAVFRTSKFLQVLARGAHVVTPDWIIKSSEAGQLLDEKDFALKDEANEKKYKFSLAEALRRARTTNIFEGHLFYVTRKVSTDWGTLSAVIRANGGEVKRGDLDLVNLTNNPNFHVISCAEDRALWRAIRKERPDIPIYTVEIALTSAIRQEVDWSGHLCDKP